MSGRAGGPVSLGAALKRVLGRMDTEGRLDEARVTDVWDEVVGERIREHAAVKGLRRGELIVMVDSPAWATELTFLAEDLRRRVNSKMGRELVGTLRFTVSEGVRRRAEEERAREEFTRRYGGERVDPVRLTEGELEIVRRSVAAIEEPGLRDVAFKATVRDLEWKKGLEAANGAQGEADALSGPNTSEIP